MIGAWAPRLMVPVVALLALFAMAPSTWLTLSVAGVAMGMMLFLMASGLTLIFGLMDVLNFAHGAFITLGAFVAVSVLGALSGWVDARMTVCSISRPFCRGDYGRGCERRRGAGVRARHRAARAGIASASDPDHDGRADHRVANSSSRFGARSRCRSPNLLCCAAVSSLRDAAIERYRVLVIVLGLAVFAAMELVLNRTRIGLLVRAGVENREMVESLGFRIRRLFVGVFVAGTALAGVGGAMWAIYQELVTAAIGSDMTILVFIVVIIGGLGIGHGMLRRVRARRTGRKLRELPRAEAGARLEHRGDDVDPAMASARAVPAREVMRRRDCCSRRHAGTSGHRGAVARAAARPGRCAVPVPRRAIAWRRRRKSASSSCWPRATTSCSVTPASSRSRTRCSSGSGRTASRFRSRPAGSAGTRSRSARCARSRCRWCWRSSSACSACACRRSSSR